MSDSRTPSDVQEDIERKVVERQQLVSKGCGPGQLAKLQDDLDKLYAELRTERAREVNGDRADIARRARVERELEKLMKPDR